MKCKYCGQSVDKIIKTETFENFMNKALKRVRNKLKKETGYGIPERRINGSQEKN